jgi:hypothetical protein
MPTQYRCGNENRRDAVRNAKDSNGDPILNGMDYLEVVSADEKTLELHFIHPLPGQTGGVPSTGDPLSDNNFVVLGGVRVQGITLKVSATADNVITLVASSAGDYSTYALQLVAGEESEQPPSGFDPQLSALRFTFKIECPSDFDCAPEDFQRRALSCWPSDSCWKASGVAIHIWRESRTRSLSWSTRVTRSFTKFSPA